MNYKQRDKIKKQRTKSLNSVEKFFLKLQFNGKDRSRIYLKLMRFLANGVPLGEALDTLWIHESKDGRKPAATVAIIINEWHRNVKNGIKFGRAIHGWVPDKDELVISAGEIAGSLETALENAVFINAGSKRIISAIVGGLAYPVLLLLIAIIFMYLFGSEIVPTFDDVLPKETWTGTGAQMAWMADFSQNWFPTIGIITFFLIAVIFVTFPRWTGKIRIFFDKFPPWSLYRLWIGAGFLLSVSALIKAGVKTTQILKIIGKDSSPWFAERIYATLRKVDSGKNLGESLYLIGYNFPDKETVLDLRAYAALDGFDETLEAMGKEWLDESIKKIEVQTAILKNVALVVLCGVFSWIASGIYDLQEQLTQAPGF